MRGKKGGSEPHDLGTLLVSYNRQCPSCRQTIAVTSERAALRLLLDEAARAATGRLSRIRLNNAIAIWQSVSKREMARPKTVLRRVR